MDNILLFPFSDYWWFYGFFTLFVFGVLALDLGVFHRKAHAVSLREAGTWSVIWVSLALVFCFCFWKYAQHKFPVYEPLLATLAEKGVVGDAARVEALRLADRTALEFLTGYVVEQALSVDNIFVFIVIFNFFGVPSQYQHRVLFYGILGAVGFRITFIALGALLIKFHWVVWVLGAFLIFTGVKVFFAEDKQLDPDKNPLIRLLRRWFPVTPGFEGQRFVVRRQGILYITPLFVCLACMEMTDIVFAVDSVPAIFAITKEPLVVFTSNIFAILGLRSMFFLLANVMHKFHLLKFGLGLILVFVGLKMVWLDAAFGGKFPIGLSLGIIGGVLMASVVLSLVFPVKPAEIEPPAVS
ncbi:MAG: rane protein [Rariglobus sp.]|nr:rane protein [Rariglobus sp.]